MPSYPTAIDSYTAVDGTTLVTDADHANMHNVVGSAVVGIETTLGTNSGTAVLKDFTAGKFAVYNSGGTLNAGVLGTPMIRGGTIGTALIGTSTVQGGTSVDQVINAGSLGTPVIVGGSIAVSGTTAPVQVGGAIFPSIITLTDAPAGTVTPNGPSGHVFSLTLGTTAGNRTIGTPANLTIDGEPILYRIKQNAAATGTVLWSAIYRFSGGTANTFQIGTTASAWNYYGFRYNASGTTIDEQSSLKNIA